MPAWVRVAAGIQQGERALVTDSRPVRVAEHDDIGVAFAPEHRQPCFATVPSMGEREPHAVSFERALLGKSLAHRRVVVVTVHAQKRLAFGLEGVEDRSGGEIPGVDHQLRLPDRFECPSGQSVAFGSVGVRNDDDHASYFSPNCPERCAPGKYLALGRQRKTMASSKSVVIAALFANGAIAIMKFGGFLLTGSAAMLSETYHSISDTGNQIFLLIGIRYGGRERSRGHPFGYGKAQFFYSFLVSVLLFGIAGWESLKEGYSVIAHGEGHLTEGAVNMLGYEIPGIWVNYIVLVAAIFFETYAFKKAYTAMRLEMEDHGWTTMREAFRKTSEITTLTALTEDTIALAGLGIALGGIYLTRATGNPIYDGGAAFLIGILLMGFAVALAWENKRLLLGESLPKRQEAELVEIVKNWDGVTGIEDFRTVYFGPQDVVVTADVLFDGKFDTDGLDQTITAIEGALKKANEDVVKVYIEPETGASD